MLRLADDIDRNEGLLAYARYNELLRAVATKYGFSIEAVIAVFVSLSPNSDYNGNLRSMVSVLEGLNNGLDATDITVSTYGHCKIRAIEYATGRRNFLAETKGPKITNFYHNCLDPLDTRWVTIDGHMSAIWQGKAMTMREGLIPLRTYREIAAAVKAIAFYHHLIPNQLQAILWFTRKRLFRVKFDPQGDLIDHANGDVWKTLKNVDSIKPYTRSEPRERIQTSRNVPVAPTFFLGE